MKKIAALYRASYTGLSPDSWWLSFVMLINRSGTMVVPFMTLYLTQNLHYSISQAGFVMALFGAGAICGGFIGGRLCSKFGFYNVQLLTLCGGGLMFMVLGYMRSYPLICGFTFILSMVNEAFRPANSIAIAHYSKPENRTRSYSLNRLAINMGWALGGTLGGFLAAKNYHLLFILDGCTNIFAAMLLRIFLAPAKETKKKEQPAKAVRTAAYKDVRYLFFSVLVVTYAYAFFQLFSTIPVYFRQVLHLSEQMIGLTMTVNGLIIGLVEMVLIYKLEGRRKPLDFIKWGTLMIAFSYLLFNLFPHAAWMEHFVYSGLIIALMSTVIVTLGEMLSMPFMNTYWISRTNDHNRGGYAGLYTVSWATAQVLGPWTGAIIADNAGFTTLWWIIGGVAVVAATGFWILQKSEERNSLTAAK